jgi:hypothetical protein
MARQTPQERREKFRSRKVKPDGDRLKQQIEAWVNHNRKDVIALYDDAEKQFPYLEQLRDRTIDIAEPLVAILEIAWKGMPELEIRRTELLEAIGVTRKDGDEFLARRRILLELSRLASADDPLVGNATELAARCELEPRPNEYAIAEALRQYGFESHSIRVGESVRYRYELPRERLAEICARFVGEQSEPKEPVAVLALASQTEHSL